jgi:hypothetical protein
MIRAHIRGHGLMDLLNGVAETALPLRGRPDMEAGNADQL